MSVLVYVREQVGAGCAPRFDRASRDVVADTLWYGSDRTEDRAVEAALQLAGDDEVTVVAVGPERTDGLLRHYLAAGAHNAIRMWDEALADKVLDDSIVVGMLATTVGDLQPDWILCSDGADTALGILLAERLGRPVATGVVSIDASAAGVEVRRRLGSWTETARVAAPAILALSRGADLRYPTLQGRIAAASADITVSTQATTPIAGIRVDAVTAPKPPRTRKGEIDTGNERIAKLVLGGATPGAGSAQVIEDQSIESMADIAVDHILKHVDIQN